MALEDKEEREKNDFLYKNIYLHECMVEMVD